jgi:hypothetical protein
VIDTQNVDGMQTKRKGSDTNLVTAKDKRKKDMQEGGGGK